jgi:hypothetical protein
MGSRHFYLRSRFEVEKDGMDTSIPFSRSAKIEPRAYMIGASAAVSSTLKVGTEIIGAILKPIGLTIRANTVQTELQRQCWIAAECLDRVATPWSDAYLDDTNAQPMERSEVGFYIAELFRQHPDYFSPFDSGAGNCFYVNDYITGRAWRFM